MIARDGEEFSIVANGGEWRSAWYPPHAEPPGTNHGAAGLCFTPDGGIVLISQDGARWSLPGGRPESGETWEQILRREVLEETCTKVTAARLLGFSRGACLSGPEQGLALVRSLWRAEVEVLPWAPRFEVPHRRIVPAAELRAHLWIDPGFEPIYGRWLSEAGL